MTENRIFKLRPKADQDLANIYHYSIQEFGGKRAELYIKDLSASFRKLVQKPELGKDYSFVRPNLLAYPVVSHVVFFKESDWGITILRVLHRSMDYGRHLK
jgi:toxin ParE1/3/4